MILLLYKVHTSDSKVCLYNYIKHLKDLTNALELAMFNKRSFCSILFICFPLQQNHFEIQHSVSQYSQQNIRVIKTSLRLQYVGFLRVPKKSASRESYLSFLPECYSKYHTNATKGDPCCAIPKNLNTCKTDYAIMTNSFHMVQIDHAMKTNNFKKGNIEHKMKTIPENMKLKKDGRIC